MTALAHEFVHKDGEIADEDRDSLHTLPVLILPIQTSIFRRARLVKNARLESVVEFFGAAGCGRGQIDVRKLQSFMGMQDQPPHPDVVLLQTVGALASFDVYSLRILLRAKDITVPDASSLRLSPSKIAALSGYMAAFTRPLVGEIFGRDTQGEKFTDIIGLFRLSNAADVRSRLATLAGRLGILVDGIPKFLEDYADIFMSLSYYRQCLDQLLPQIMTFMDGITMVRESPQFARDKLLMSVINMIEATINGTLASVTGKIESFERSTNDMWREITAERFKRIQQLIGNYHTSIGAALCAITVKMSAWNREFPTSSVGGAGRRAAFVMSDIRQGIELITKDENDAPLLSGLDG